MRCGGKLATKKPNRRETVGQPCKIRPWKQAVEIAIFWRYSKEKRLWHLFCHSLLVAETGLEPATSGLWEIQNLCVTVLFCWAWWYCVPRLRMDFVPCVQKSTTSCWPVPTPFGGSFGGKSAKWIQTRTAQINAQLWSHWEIRIPSSQGSYTGNAPRTSNEVLLSIQKLYANPLHAIPARRPCHREKRPCLGASSPHRRGSRPVKYRPKIPAFRGFLFYHKGIYLDGISLYRKILHK